MREQRDTLWKSYLAAKENCRVLRAYNKDLEDEVLAKGRMIVLALEVKSDSGKTDDAEDKSMKQAQKSLYSMMIANREAGTEVCQEQKRANTKYMMLVRNFAQVELSLKVRLAHGCFFSGESHYCLSVKTWCGKGADTHPCVTEVKATPEAAHEATPEAIPVASPEAATPEAATQDAATPDAATPEAASPALSMIEISEGAVIAAKRAIDNAVWPTQNQPCFSDSSARHCAEVTSWVRPARASGSHLPQRLVIRTMPLRYGSE